MITRIKIEPNKFLKILYKIVIFLMIFSNLFSVIEIDIQDLINIGVNSNNEILKFEEEKNEAKMKTWNSYKLFLPKINYTGTFNRFEDPVIPFEDDSNILISHTFSITQPIFQGGSLIGNSLILSYDEEIIQNKILQRKRELKINLIEKYINIIKLQTSRDIYKASLEELKENDWKLTQKYNSGLVSKNSLSEMKYKISELEAEIYSFEINIKELKNSLKTDLGIKSKEDINLKELNFDKINLKELNFDKDFVEILKSDYNLKINSVLNKQLEIKKLISIGKMLPTINFSYSNTLKDYHWLESKKKRQPWNYTFTMSVDLWDWAEKFDNYKITEIQKKQLEYEKNIYSDKLEVNIRNLYYDLLKKNKYVEAKIDALNFAEEKAKIEKEKFYRDLSTFTDYLAAENDLRKFKAELANSRLDLYFAYLKYKTFLEK